MSTKYPQGLITGTPPYTTGNFSGVWTPEQLAQKYYFFGDGVANSLRFRSSASAYLNRTPASAGNQKTWTWSGWVKRGALGASNFVLFSRYVDATNFAYLRFTSTGSDELRWYEAASGVPVSQRDTTQVFRDPSAWYHIMLVYDTTQATAADRVKIYVNGTQVTSFTTTVNRTQNADGLINAAAAHQISAMNAGTFFDGYLAEVNFIDGQALDPSYFGVVAPATGVWSPKRYAGTYGLNGFYLNFSNGTSTTTLGYDASGNSNNWTTNNISLTAGSTYDWMIDSPTPYQGSSYGVGNYAVWNAVKLQGNSTSNANLRATLTAGGPPYLAGYGVRATIAVPSSGKWYCEITPATSDTWSYIGIADVNGGAADVSNAGLYSVLYRANGDKNVNGSASAYGASYTTDVIGVALDSDAGTITFYKNNTSQGSISLPSSTISYCFVVANGNAQSISFDATFGQRPFSYTPPSGYNSLCSFNLPGPTINNGASYFAATTYTGTGATQSLSNAVNSVSFKPDLVWTKARSAAIAGLMYDSVRGATKYLQTNSASAEGTGADSLTAFNANGFSAGADTSTTGVNQNGTTYIGWQWKASNAAAVTNASGTITSQVSANTTAGFSVVTYTGTGSAATVGHGLGVAPAMIIVKNRTTSGEWWHVYHQSLGATKAVFLNSTNAAGTSSDWWNNTAPTSSVFTVNISGAVNGSGAALVAYCFAAIAGYSAFGSYTGNGSADGPFVYCGFRPRFVICKDSSNAGDWLMIDSSRSSYNVSAAVLLAQSSAAEVTNTEMDLLSNGFKFRNTGAGSYANNSGQTYIYAAFAENPFKYSLAR